MKHHEYQIYYGGFKIKLKNKFYCLTCGIVKQNHKPWNSSKTLKIVRSHKKQAGVLAYKRMLTSERNVIQKKN